MNDTPCAPSGLLKLIAAMARWLLGIAIGAWILIALSVLLLHGFIVPRIDDYRAALETRVGAAIGLPVRIGALRAESSGLIPTITATDVVLEDHAQREALRLPRVVVSVSPRSLLRLGFEQIYIDGPTLDVRRDPAGKLHVGGLDASGGIGTGSDAADWFFFSQRELVIEHGSVRWTDEARSAPPLDLSDVRFVARNIGRRHQLQLDATPPPGWGMPLSLRADLRQPLLSTHAGDWQRWSGVVFADFPDVDVSQLRRYTTLDVDVREGSGAVRLWVDVASGQPVSGALDLALSRIDVSFGAALQPLMLSDVRGRIAQKRNGRNGDEVEFATTDLQFVRADGSRWPGGNAWLSHRAAEGDRPERTAFRADRLDLGALARIATRLPISEATRRALDAYAPEGLVEQIDTSWLGSLGAPTGYEARGRVSGLAVAAQTARTAQTAQKAKAATPGDVDAQARSASAASTESGGTPGVRGATVVFDFTQSGGQATIAITDGALELPGVFEEAVVPIARLATQATWKKDGDLLSVQLANLTFGNADADGEAQVDWRTTDPATSKGGQRFPGRLDLQGRLTRADGTRVWRYLPLVIPKGTRDYVQRSVVKGTAPQVDFNVSGDLRDMPFTDPKAGQFRIAAKVAGVTYAYVPPTPEDGDAPWPALVNLSGELVFERAGMSVRGAHGGVAGAPGIEIGPADARIADLSHRAATLQVDAQAKGPLDELRALAASLAGDASAWARETRASGNAQYKLALSMPVAQPDKAKVDARVTLEGNRLLLQPGAPALEQTRGTAVFSESGFQLAGVHALLAGGEIKVEGKGRYAGPPAGRTLDVSADGVLTAEGLREAGRSGDGKGLGEALGRLAGRMSGSTPYRASLSLAGAESRVLFSSTLQGLGLTLPAPLAKAPVDSLALRIERIENKALGRGLDQLSLTLGDSADAGATAASAASADSAAVASALYVRDVSGAAPRVLRGAIGVGLDRGRPPVLPETGVLANLKFAHFDPGAWEALFKNTTGAAPVPPAAGKRVAGGPGNESGADPAQAYVPNVVALRAGILSTAGRELHDVTINGSREGATWRGNVQARELAGFVEYREARDGGPAGSEGRLYARLARLTIAPGAASEVESLLDEKPTALPALDIVIDNFELLGKPFGKAEINAVNRGGANREWRLNTLRFTTPDARFDASGSWANAPLVNAAIQPNGPARRMALDFKLDIRDAGALLARFKMPGVVRAGAGRMEGQLDWSGSPFALDYPSLAGQLHIDVAQGQFLKADPGLAKLLGVLSLQALPRRLTLDFNDLFSKGFAFDFIRGDARITAGIARTDNLQMKGVNAAVLMDGSTDLARETQHLRVAVVPEFDAGTAALVAAAINPAIGLATFLAQRVLREPLAAAATRQFQIDGSWADPQVTPLARGQVPADARTIDSAEAAGSRSNKE